MTSWRTRQVPARRYGASLFVLTFLTLIFLVAVACNGETESQTTASPTVPRLTAMLPTVSPTAPSSLDASGFCSAGDLEASASYQGATMSMAGSIVVTNVSATPCVVQGHPGLRMTDGKGNVLAVKGQLSGDESEVIRLQPGERSGVIFVWRNWCPPGVRQTSAGSAISGGVVFLVNLPQDGGQLTVPATDPSGRSSGLVPTCNAPGVTSTISVGSFERSVTN